MVRSFPGLMSLLLIVGCQSSTAPHTAASDPVAEPANNPRIQVLSGDLVKSIGIERPIVARNDDLLMVTVPTRNLSNDTYYLDYKYVWYDADKREVKPLMGWKEVVLPSRTQRDLTANALDERALDWKLMIRWANR